MWYPVAIHKDINSDYSTTVPDIHGCFSTGETIDKVLINTTEAISSHLEILAEDGLVAPKGTIVDTHKDKADFEDVTWAYVDVDVSAFLGKTEKATITLPKLLIKKIDAAVAAGAAKNRSAFLANSAIQSLNRQIKPAKIT